MVADHDTCDTVCQDFVAANSDTQSADVFRAKSVMETVGERKMNSRVAEALAQEARCVACWWLCLAGVSPTVLCSDKAIGHLNRKFFARSEVNTDEVLKRTSFWVPQYAPSAAVAKLKKVCSSLACSRGFMFSRGVRAAA